VNLLRVWIPQREHRQCLSQQFPKIDQIPKVKRLKLLKYETLIMGKGRSKVRCNFSHIEMTARLKHDTKPSKTSFNSPLTDIRKTRSVWILEFGQEGYLRSR